MDDKKIYTSCTECGADIYEGQRYVTDSRLGSASFCSDECCSKAVEDSGFGWDNYQAWKD
ncbi:hypothetical protein ABH916_003453 [Peribacillus frigoritolerans]|uniref:hypothetical protein n=1 Tax=Peribacillus frigoritolerans TaxID=450367 RepID=UPI003838E9CE